MEAPTVLQFQAAKRVLHYLKGTIDFSVLYKRDKSKGLVGYSDSDFSRDLDDRRALQVMFSCLVLGEFHGLQRSSRWSLCPQLKPSLVQLLLVHVKLCG